MNRLAAYILALQNTVPKSSIVTPVVSPGSNVITNNVSVSSSSPTIINQASSTSKNFIVEVTGTIENSNTVITVYIQYTDLVTGLITQQYLAQNQSYSPQSLNFPIVPISSSGPVQVYASSNPINNLILNVVIGVQ
jgi:hypothetical protein